MSRKSVSAEKDATKPNDHGQDDDHHHQRLILLTSSRLVDTMYFLEKFRKNSSQAAKLEMKH